MSFTRKKIIKIGFLSVVIIATAITLRLIKHDAQKYQTYKSSDPAFNFTFEYPETWKMLESRGKTENYAMVHAIGPRDEQKEFSVGFFITIKEAGDQTTDELLLKHIKSVERFKDFRVIKQRKKHVAGQPNPSAVYQYTMNLPLHKLNAKQEIMREESGFLVKEGKSYNLNFLGTEEQFEKYKPVFQKLLNTFRFN